MIKHISFLITYILLYNVLSAEILLIILMLHCSYCLVENIKSKQLSLLTVIYATTLFCTFANFVLLTKISSGVEIHSVYNYIVPAYAPEAVLLWCIGNAFIFIGYEMFSKKSLPDISVTIRKSNFETIYFAVLIYDILDLTGHSLNLAFLGGGGVKIIALLNLMSILIFARLWTKENNSKYMLYSISLCILQTYFALKTSYLRELIILPTLSLMGGYFLGFGTLKSLISYRIVPFLIILISFFTLFKKLSNNRSHFIDAAQDDNNSIEEDTDDQGKGGIVDRMSNLAQITNCIKLTKQNGFYYGKAFEPLIIGVIPRVLWPDKPQIHLGIWFAVEIGVAYVNAEGIANNSLNMTIPGELYIDFGYIGAIIGCLLLGCILAMFWNASHFNESTYNITGLMWGGYLIESGLGAYNSADLQIVITLFSTYFVFYIIKKITEK